MAGVERLPYRLPELLAADQTAIIYICEGEKDADRLASLGLVATTNPGGAGNWLAAFSCHLEGRTVIILADNDESGRAHAADVRAKLHGHAQDIAILALPGLPPKGDVSDWLDTGGTVDRLNRLALEALEAAMGDAGADDPTHEEAGQPWPLPVELFGDIRPALDRRELITGLVPIAGKIVLFGYPGSGKSFLALDMSLCIAAGLDWHGRRTQQGGVVYIGAEGQAGLRLRVAAHRRTHGVAADTPFALIPTSVDLLDPAADLDKLADILRRLAEKWGGLALVSVDTLAATFGGGDENGSDMATYISNVARLCEPHGSASMIVHHQPLNAEAKRPRGHGSLWGAADTVLHCVGDSTSIVRRLVVTKAKDCEPAPDFQFRLQQVEIGLDSEGQPVTSCIITETDAIEANAAGKRRLTPKEKIAIKQLERIIAEMGVFPPSDIPDKVLNRARTAKVISVSEWRSSALSALTSPDTKPDTARRTFERVRDSLQAAEILGIWEDWVWFA